VEAVSVPGGVKEKKTFQNSSFSWKREKILYKFFEGRK